MRAVIQRVSQAKVTIDGKVTGEISQGLLILLGVHKDDTEKDASYLADKCVNLRVFEDEEGKMNHSLQDISGSMLVVSQFTLFGDCRKGRRPSYGNAAPPEMANHLYENFVSEVKKHKIPTETGTFQAMMDVSLVNDGPVTILLDSK